MNAMLKNLKDLFDSFIAPAGNPSTGQLEHTLQLATAVLLVEVMRADPAMAADERSAVLGALREKFGLGDDELRQLMSLAGSGITKPVRLSPLHVGVERALFARAENPRRRIHVAGGVFRCSP
jgi:uncharacterized tellurite resistance protein B-like protein